MLLRRMIRASVHQVCHVNRGLACMRFALWPHNQLQLWTMDCTWLQGDLAEAIKPDDCLWNLGKPPTCVVLSASVPSNNLWHAQGL